MLFDLGRIALSAISARLPGVVAAGTDQRSVTDRRTRERQAGVDGAPVDVEDRGHRSAAELARQSVDGGLRRRVDQDVPPLGAGEVEHGRGQPHPLHARSGEEGYAETVPRESTTVRGAATECVATALDDRRPAG